MLLQKTASTLAGLAICLSSVFSQSSVFTGTFLNASSTISVQYKQVGTAFHGLMQSSDGSNFAIKATVKGNQMTGTIYGATGPVAFTATAGANGITVSSSGFSDFFYKTSATHNLAGVDLTPYFVAPNGNGDYDYSYSQSSNGQASESSRTSTNTGGSAVNSPYPAYNDSQLFGLIAGSQLVYYTRTSYVNDNTASSITYVNFCANGKFQINYDGSFGVEGYGGNAQGATYGQNSGKWQLVSYQGQPAVFLAFNNGTTSVNAVIKSNLVAGRWRVGNTQYALVRNKVSCR
ncbi:MAG: hypothetical protein IPK21_18500 [Haliscomenobacter sp.]|nr:hypothetical protein [Haliscomenobacter sp.]